MEEQGFALPKQTNKLLALLFQLYKDEGKQSLQEILVNAKISVEENYDYELEDFYSVTLHTLRLCVPDLIFIKNARKRDELQFKIVRDLNTLHDIQRERFGQAVISVEADALGELDNWRNESGLKLESGRNVSPTAEERIWKNGSFRVFLSHSSKNKRIVVAIKEALMPFGISAFVAHSDIHPTKAWQEEIENALASADALVALITPNFKESDWTDQEVGYAMARGLPVITIRYGHDPYGFIGKFQALTWGPDDNEISISGEITRLLSTHERLINAYISALKECSSFAMGNNLATFLPHIKQLTEVQINDLVDIYNTNSELRGSFGFNGKQRNFGQGLVHHLNRLSHRKFEKHEHMNSFLIRECNPLSQS